MRILVVDDNLADLFHEAFTEHHHQVVAALDGHQALRLLEAEPFDVVITDVFHPGPSGHAIAVEAVRRGLPAFLLSAGSFEPCPEGVVCLPKPVELEEFIDLVEASPELPPAGSGRAPITRLRNLPPLEGARYSGIARLLSRYRAGTRSAHLVEGWCP
jgi:CheY-like chemotaxis protein